MKGPMMDDATPPPQNRGARVRKAGGLTRETNTLARPTISMMVRDQKHLLIADIFPVAPFQNVMGQCRTGH